MVWASRKLVEFLYTSPLTVIVSRNPPSASGNPMKESLSPQQEAQAHELAQAILDEARDDILKVARTLIAATDASLFGDTELEVRDALLAVAAKAYRRRLAQKKTATGAPE